MQIPVYKSQLRPTSEAPGARITARMNAQPFVNAALQKGAVGTEIINQVGEYANMRYKMIVETQKNEAIFSAKEALMGLSSTLEKSTDFANIFDGENKYNEGVNGVFNELRATVGKNKYALQDFDNSFRQMEIPIKFRLKEVVDIRIEKRRQAALKALRDQQVDVFSDPYLDYTSDDLILSQANLQSIHNQAVSNGGINPDLIGNVSKKVLSQALKRVIPAYAGTDLNTAIGLVNVLDQIQQVNSGKLDASKMQVSGTIPNHVINMLQAVPAEEAAAVVQDTLKMASSYFSAQEKADDEEEEELDKINTKAYNAVVSLNLSDMVTQEQLKELLPANVWTNLDGLLKFKDNFSGLEAKRILIDSLNGQFWASPSQQETMLKSNEIGSTYAPAGKGNVVKFNEMYDMAVGGMLTVENLKDSSVFITSMQYKELSQIIFSRDNESLNVGSRLLSDHFRYNAEQAIDKNDRLSQASKTAFYAANFALRDRASEREAEGNPMTLSEIRFFAKEKISEFDSIYREQLREEYETFVLDQSSDIIGLTVDLSNPLESIDAWYDSLSSDGQQQNRSFRNSFKSQVRARYSNQGLF